MILLVQFGYIEQPLLILKLLRIKFYMMKEEGMEKNKQDPK